MLYTVGSVSWWAGAAAHQAAARVTLQKTSLLNAELLSLLQRYFADLASLDTMITDMLVMFFKILSIEMPQNTFASLIGGTNIIIVTMGRFDVQTF